MANIQETDERRTAETWQTHEESRYVDAQLRNQLYRLM